MPIPSLTAGFTLRFRRDQTIFHQGDDSGFVYRVTSGGVRLCRVRANGRRQIMGFLLPGDVFGIEQTGQRSLAAEALCESAVARFARSHLDRLAEGCAEVQHEVMALLRQEISDTQDHAVMLGRQTAKERLATFLLQLATRSEAAAGRTFAVPMSRGDMADFLGLTLETVCRTIADLKREGLLAVPGRGRLAIRDLDALADIANGDEAVPAHRPHIRDRAFDAV